MGGGVVPMHICIFCDFKTHKKYNLDMHKRSKHKNIIQPQIQYQQPVQMQQQIQGGHFISFLFSEVEVFFFLFRDKIFFFFGVKFFSSFCRDFRTRCQDFLFGTSGSWDSFGWPPHMSDGGPKPLNPTTYNPYPFDAYKQGQIRLWFMEILQVIFSIKN